MLDSTQTVHLILAALDQFIRSRRHSISSFDNEVLQQCFLSFPPVTAAFSLSSACHLALILAVAAVARPSLPLCCRLAPDQASGRDDYRDRYVYEQPVDDAAHDNTGVDVPTGINTNRYPSLLGAIE